MNDDRTLSLIIVGQQNTPFGDELLLYDGKRTELNALIWQMEKGKLVIIRKGKCVYDRVFHFVGDKDIQFSVEEMKKAIQILELGDMLYIIDRNRICKYLIFPIDVDVKGDTELYTDEQTLFERPIETNELWKSK